MNIKTKKSKRGGKRPGSGRKKGVPNKSTIVLKEVAGEFSKEAVDTLVAVMRDSKTPPATKVQAADKILDRSHGKPTQDIDLKSEFKMDRDFMENIETKFIRAMKIAHERQAEIYRERANIIGEDLSQELQNK
jgi:hypothetical protein